MSEPGDGCFQQDSKQNRAHPTAGNFIKMDLGTRSHIGVASEEVIEFCLALREG